MTRILSHQYAMRRRATRALSPPSARPPSYYVSAHSNVNAQTPTFIVPTGVSVVFKVDLGQWDTHGGQPVGDVQASDWGVQRFAEGDTCLDHLLGLPRDDLYEEAVVRSRPKRRRSRQRTCTRVMLHGMYRIPLPRWFDEFPCANNTRLRAKMDVINLLKDRRQIRLSDVIKRSGDGVYFVSCCRVILAAGREWQVTSDHVVSSNEPPRFFFRHRASRRITPPIQTAEGVYESMRARLP